MKKETRLKFGFFQQFVLAGIHCICVALEDCGLTRFDMLLYLPWDQTFVRFTSLQTFALNLYIR